MLELVKDKEAKIEYLELLVMVKETKEVKHYFNSVGKIDCS